LLISLIKYGFCLMQLPSQYFNLTYILSPDYTDIYYVCNFLKIIDLFLSLIPKNSPKKDKAGNYSCGDSIDEGIATFNKKNACDRAHDIKPGTKLSKYYQQNHMIKAAI